MKILCNCIAGAVREPAASKVKYLKICRALIRYQEQYPLYFEMALGEINMDFEKGDPPPVEKETYDVGEQINRELAGFIKEGMDAGELKPDIPVLPTVFLFWSSLAGLIQTASKKQAYIEKSMNLTGQEFLEFGFEQLFKLIEAV